MMTSFTAAAARLWLIYLAAINLAAFVVYGLDKRYSKTEGRRRVPEDTLLVLAGVGGSLGALAAIWTFRHKTRHRRFTVGVPAILAAQVLVLALYFYFSTT